jgi:hypothetical protein
VATYKKKLQVFVSSTFVDLRQERQAAVEAILEAGHIPAGMELFASGDESQMEVIRQWIDDSDVFFLILGGRYGSVEPISKKSYIQLEFEYATEKKKPIFSVVMTDVEFDRRNKEDSSKCEREYFKEWKDFRNTVRQKLVEHWSDSKDIKLAVHKSLAHFVRDESLVGWIRGDEAGKTPEGVSQELARLSTENAALRKALNDSENKPPIISSGLTFPEFKRLLEDEKIDITKLPRVLGDKIQGLSSKPRLFHFFIVMGGLLADGLVVQEPRQLNRMLEHCFFRLKSLGMLIDDGKKIELTKEGLAIHFQCKLNYSRSSASWTADEKDRFFQQGAR